MNENSRINTNIFIVFFLNIRYNEDNASLQKTKSAEAKEIKEAVNQWNSFLN